LDTTKKIEVSYPKHNWKWQRQKRSHEDHLKQGWWTKWVGAQTSSQVEFDSQPDVTKRKEELKVGEIKEAKRRAHKPVKTKVNYSTNYDW